MNANEFDKYIKKITGPDRQRELLTSTDPVTGKSITGLKGRSAAPRSAGPGFTQGGPWDYRRAFSDQITDQPEGSRRVIRKNPDGTFTVKRYTQQNPWDTDPTYVGGVQNADLSYIRALQGLKDPELGFREQPVGAAEVESALAGEPWGMAPLPGGGYPVGSSKFYTVGPSGGIIPRHLFPEQGESLGPEEPTDSLSMFFDFLSRLQGNRTSTAPAEIASFDGNALLQELLGLFEGTTPTPAIEAPTRYR
jgi:hypothetical protein